ncbi:DUF1269 domain-containing protein [Methanoculleus sp. FWC-SCC1]|uniref:DUF1269 domain-containing protein n=1 Tax=Methanoculleus frigidifontis TaxID=2584085 RepID=A0ABT8MDQ3_9EURY|nr:DUF1269 domain-containing protein [Methanoculleus sp. FWC-SCC1]MDN7026026.1 DUF1269 domain-containing protein [Methanoculleus sp. FWC-SCC1]
MAEVMYGPMHLLVIGFENPDFHGQIRRALGSAMEKGVVRLIDLRFVWKDADGNVTAMEATQLDEEERQRFGAAVGALIGLGAGGMEGARRGAEMGAMAAAEKNYGMDQDDVREEVIAAIPNNSAAAVLLIEHLWAKDLKGALRDAHGSLIAQGIIEPEALVMAGAALREAVEAAEEEEGKTLVAASVR